MRRLVLLSALPLLVLLAVLASAGFLLVGGSGSSTGAAGSGAGCDPSVVPVAAVTIKGGPASQLGTAQITLARTIIGVGKAKNVPARGWVDALTAALQESRLRNLANPALPESLRHPHDGTGNNYDSLGPFQQRPSQGWGSIAQLMTPTYAAGAFYDRLVKVPGWQGLDAAVAVQAVQRSAFPAAYGSSVVLAGQLVTTLAGVDDVSGCAQLASSDLGGMREQIIVAAQRYLGYPYAWAAGDANGPTLGKHDGGVGDAHGDYAKLGFDCSGLTLYSWAQVGIQLDHYAATQYHQGRQVPIAQAQPGDLLFWATNTSDPASIHHVAIYLGNDRMIEAPESGEFVHETAVRHDSELMPLAVEPIVTK